MIGPPGAKLKMNPGHVLGYHARHADALLGPKSAGEVKKVSDPVILALDFETASQSADSACQLAVVRIEGWELCAAHSWLIRPPSDEFVFTYLHGIAWEHVAGEPDFGALWPQLKPHFQGVDFLAAHNAPFDRGVLAATCDRYGLTPPETPYIDTVQVARKVWKIFPTKLNLVAAHLGIALNHHEALSDAKACAQIMIRAHAEGWLPSVP